MRDSKGRFVRKHMYRLVYDRGASEDVRAYTPSEAVACRKGGYGSLLPHTISDMTALDEWVRNIRTSRAGIHITLEEV